MNVSLQRVESGIFPAWVTELQLMDVNHKGINRALAEVNVLSYSLAGLHVMHKFVITLFKISHKILKRCSSSELY